MGVEGRASQGKQGRAGRAGMAGRAGQEEQNMASDSEAQGKVWIKECEDKRKNMGAADEPWTGRRKVVCKGLSHQLSSVNFLHETLNLRWGWRFFERMFRYLPW